MLGQAMSVVLAGEIGKIYGTAPPSCASHARFVLSAVVCVCCTVSVIDAGRTYRCTCIDAHVYAYAYAYTYAGQYKCTYINMHTKLSRVEGLGTYI